MRINRAIHVDFHTMPNITDFGARYSAEEFAARLAASGVEYINLVASVSVTETEKYRLVHIRTDYPEIKNGKGVIEEHVLLKRGRQVCVDGEYDEIFDAKTGKKVKSRTKKGYTLITLPEIRGYLMLCLPIKR